jgi:hypothetical protein
MRFRFKEEMTKYYAEHRKLDPQKVGEAITKLGAEPERMIEAARPARSPLHNGFDWDDTQAAHSWRLNQARHLIAAIITDMPSRNGDVETRAFMAVKGKSGFEYQRIDRIMGDEDYRVQVLRRALDDLRIFRNRYASLADVLGALSDLERSLMQEIDRSSATREAA